MGLAVALGLLELTRALRRGNPHALHLLCQLGVRQLRARVRAASEPACARRCCRSAADVAPVGMGAAVVGSGGV